MNHYIIRFAMTQYHKQRKKSLLISDFHERLVISDRGDKKQTHAHWIILNFNVHSVISYSKSKEGKKQIFSYKNITFGA